MVIIVYIAILLRIATQLWGNDTWYFVGVHVFDSAALNFIASKLQGLQSRIVHFIPGCAFFNIVKPLYADPSVTGHDAHYFLFGLLFLLIEYAYKITHK